LDKLEDILLKDISECRDAREHLGKFRCPQGSVPGEEGLSYYYIE